MTNGEPEIAVNKSLQKIKSIKNQHKKNSSFFYVIKSQTSDSFVNHFDGHFAYLKDKSKVWVIFDTTSVKAR